MRFLDVIGSLALSDDDNRLHKHRLNYFNSTLNVALDWEIELLPLSYRRMEKLYSFIGRLPCDRLISWGGFLYQLLFRIFLIFDSLKLILSLGICIKAFNELHISGTESKNVFYSKKQRDNYFDFAHGSYKNITRGKTQSCARVNVLEVLKHVWLSKRFTVSEVISYLIFKRLAENFFEKNDVNCVSVYEGFSWDQRVFLRVANKFNIHTKTYLKNLNYRIRPLLILSNEVVLSREIARCYLDTTVNMVTVLERPDSLVKLEENTNQLRIMIIPELFYRVISDEKRRRIVRMITEKGSGTSVRIEIRFHPNTSEQAKRRILKAYKRIGLSNLDMSDSNKRIEDVLYDQDWIISEYYSTVLEDASLAGVEASLFASKNENYTWICNNIVEIL